MNCPECMDFLQCRLDGSDDAVPRALEAHLAACADCRAWFVAARRLADGLHRQVSPSVPAYLTGNIVSALVTYQRRRRLRRWLVAGTAVAASVCLAILIGYRVINLPAPEPGPQARQDSSAHPEKILAAPEAPSLRRGVDAARSAMAALTGDLTTSTRRFLGSAAVPLKVESFTPFPTVAELEQPLEPAARSLRESGRGVAVSMAAVTGSARRAVDYFLHELPGLPSAKKAGL